MKYIVASVLFLTVLTGCKLSGIPDLREACNVMEAAGVNRNFRMTRDEAMALTHEHRVIINNIKRWYKENC